MDIYEELKREMKWKVMDNRILMTIASLYVMNDRAFHLERLLQLADKIKKRAGIFSSMRSHPRYTTAALFDVKTEEPETKINDLFSLYKEFRHAKFKSGVYTYLAASTLFTQDLPSSDAKGIINKTSTIYEGMKKEHPFLTGTSDYPLAVLLALEERPGMIEIMETYYDQLSKNGFTKGNDLQFLSHILSLSSKENHQTLVQRAADVFQAFKQEGIKPKTMYYPVIGMLALSSDLFEMKAIREMYEEMNDVKHFKWQKDMNVIMAVSFYINEKMDQNSLPETSLYTALESILQAQQAVMIAAMTASAAAATSSSNN